MKGKDMNFDDVKKEHMELTGASDVRFTLGPGATPEGVRDALAKIRSKSEKYESFSELERAQANIARLKSELRAIMKKYRCKLDDMTQRDANKLLGDIFCIAEMACILDSDLDRDVEWMELNRADPTAARNNRTIYEK